MTTFQKLHLAPDSLAGNLVLEHIILQRGHWLVGQHFASIHLYAPGSHSYTIGMVMLNLEYSTVCTHMCVYAPIYCVRQCK